MRGKSRPLRYSTALGSLRESLSCLEVAEAMGYLGGVDRSISNKYGHCIATLVKVSK